MSIIDKLKNAFTFTPRPRTDKEVRKARNEIIRKVVSRRSTFNFPKKKS